MRGAARPRTRLRKLFSGWHKLDVIADPQQLTGRRLLQLDLRIGAQSCSATMLSDDELHSRVVERLNQADPVEGWASAEDVLSKLEVSETTCGSGP